LVSCFPARGHAVSAWNPHRHQLVPLPDAERDRRYDQGFFYFNLLLLTVAMGTRVSSGR
jgi:hypothetical protein